MKPIAGVDAISLINTVKGMAIDINKRKLSLGNVTGGLSGPAIKPIALHNIYEAAKVVQTPLIGCGGITSASDALEFIMCGASAVQIGTANLTNPSTSLVVLDGIRHFMEDNGINKLTELISTV